MELHLEIKNENHRHAIVGDKGAVELSLLDCYSILQIDPFDNFVAFRLASLLVRQKKYQDAHRLTKSLLKIENSYRVLRLLAEIEYELDLHFQSIENFLQALMVAPLVDQELFTIYKLLGNLFVKVGDLDSAEENYNKAYRLKPHCDVLQVNLGTLCLQKNAMEKAIEHFRLALDLNISNDRAWVGLAIGHRHKGDFELAWGNLETGLDRNPLNEPALLLALEWGSREGREFRVLEWIRRFLSEGGWNERLSLAFSWLAFRRGERALSLLELERLLLVNPQHDQALTFFDELRFSHV